VRYKCNNNNYYYYNYIQEGHSITWDVTTADQVAESYLANTSVTAGAAAEAAAERKTAKYTAFSHFHINIFSLYSSYRNLRPNL
jgi:tRNA A37 threonylcarbamoyladenosine modification protein TsaB